MLMCSYFLLFSDYMAHLVEVQHERGATGGQTFHSLLTASLPARRGTAQDSLNISRLLNFPPWLLLRGTGRNVLKSSCVAINQQATVRHQFLLDFFASGNERNSNIFGVYYSKFFWVIRKSRSCLELKEKLLNSSAVRDCKAEGDLVLGLQMLSTITAFSFLSFHSSCRQRWDCKVKI